MIRMQRIDFIPREKCCGCGACANICNRNAICMKEDREGFLYPVVDKEKCVDCGMCKTHCPVFSQEKLALKQHHVENYAGYLANEEDLLKSASGGVATALARAVLRNGGVVFGVAYAEDYRRAVTVKVPSEEELSVLRDSKYMQSDKGNIYHELKTELEKGVIVLYTGTPCEIGAVKAFLGREYENLYLCELICHGPTSYKVASDYLQEQERKNKSRLIHMSVKSKKYGWSIPHLLLEFENGQSTDMPFYQSDYGIGFTVLSRESCYHCTYKGDRKVADITLGDFWGADKTDDYWNPDGISAISIHTEQGKKLLQMASELKLFPVQYETILRGNPHLEESAFRDRMTDSFRWIFSCFGLTRAARMFRLYRGIVSVVKKAGKR